VVETKVKTGSTLADNCILIKCKNPAAMSKVDPDRMIQHCEFHRQMYRERRKEALQMKRDGIREMNEQTLLLLENVKRLKEENGSLEEILAWRQRVQEK